MSFSSSNRALVVRFMLGMAFCVFFGVKGVINTPPLEKLEHYKGRLEWIRSGYITPRDSDKKLYGVILKLQGSNTTFGTWINLDEDVIASKVKQDSEIELWIDRIEGNVVQVKTNGNLIVKYDQFKAMRFYLVLIMIGIVFLILIIISIVKHPEIISARIAREKGVKF